MDGFRSRGMFCLVDFKGGRRRTVIPDTWLSVNNNLCLLPPNATDSDLEVLVRNLAEPGEGWQMLEVSSLQTFESYTEAKKQLDESKEAPQSTTSSQRKRKKPSDGRTPYTVFGVDFDEDAMSENEWIRPPEFSPRMENVPSVKRTIRNDHRPRNNRFNQPLISSQKENIDFTCDCQSSCHGTMLQTMRSMQNQLDRMGVIFQMVHQLLGGQKQTHSQLKRVLQNLTVKQMNGQEEMDVFSQDSTNFAQCNQSTPTVQKETENATAFSEAEDTSCISGDQSSTSEVVEVEFKKSLKDQVQLALKKFPIEDTELVLRTLEKLGVEDKDDLKYVKSNDLLDVLSEVQARILVESFQTNSESDEQNSSKLGSQHHLLRHETKVPKAEKNSAVNISWERMSSELVADLKSNKEPQSTRYREMVRVIADDILKYIADDILKYNKKPLKPLVRSVAESCAQKYPVLKDKYEGTVIGSGFDTLTRKLCSRLENTRRNRSVSFDCGKGDDQRLKKFRKCMIGLDSYGCVAWAPTIPDKKTLASLEKKKISLLKLEASKDREKISILMRDTYSLQRKEINEGTKINYLLSEWPFLFKTQGMLDHFEILTGVDIRQQTGSIIEMKCKTIFPFFHSSDKMKVKAFIIDNDSTRNKLALLFIAIALYFDEDPSECIRICEGTDSSNDNKDIPFHPCLIGKGTTTLKAREFMICIDKVVVSSEIKDANDAVLMLFAAYYVFNVAYPKSIALTLEFFQRCLIGINPPTGSKTERKRKYYQIHPRLLTVVNKLKNFEERLSTSTKL